ncbi:MAG: hypothetical protein AAGA54_29900 [Myxococcota bacterium]
MADRDERPRDASSRAAEDLVDAATGLDGRALLTLRDLVVRPWTMIRRAALENDPEYVGAVKLALAMSTVAIVVMSWLIPSELYFDGMRAADPEAWSAFSKELDANGICLAHFSDRFSNRHELLNTAATLAECGVFALLFLWFDRTRAYFTHLSVALYCYSLWLLVSLPLQLLAGTDLGGPIGMTVGLVLIALLPGLLITAVVKFYPASRIRQTARGVGVLVLTGALFAGTSVIIAEGAMLWTRASFDL